MENQGMKRAAQRPKSERGEKSTSGSGGGVDDLAGNARDREMGREAEPLGDLGGGNRTWAPPVNEQGMSNRPGDAGDSADGDGGENRTGNDRHGHRGQNARGDNADGNTFVKLLPPNKHRSKQTKKRFQSRDRLAI